MLGCCELFRIDTFGEFVVVLVVALRRGSGAGAVTSSTYRGPNASVIDNRRGLNIRVSASLYLSVSTHICRMIPHSVVTIMLQLGSNVEDVFGLPRHPGPP